MIFAYRAEKTSVVRYVWEFSASPVRNCVQFSRPYQGVGPAPSEFFQAFFWKLQIRLFPNLFLHFKVDNVTQYVNNTAIYNKHMQKLIVFVL